MTKLEKNDLLRKVHSKLFSAGFTRPDVRTGDPIEGHSDELEVNSIRFGPEIREDRGGSIAVFKRFRVYAEEEGWVRVRDFKTGETEMVALGDFRGFIKSALAS